MGKKILKHLKQGIRALCFTSTPCSQPTLRPNLHPWMDDKRLSLLFFSLDEGLILSSLTGLYLCFLNLWSLEWHMVWKGSSTWKDMSNTFLNFWSRQIYDWNTQQQKPGASAHASGISFPVKYLSDMRTKGKNGGEINFTLLYFNHTIYIFLKYLKV